MPKVERSLMSTGQIRGRDLGTDPGWQQVTGAGALGKAEISLAKSIQTVREGT